MKIQILQTLLEKYLAQTTSQKESLVLDEWYNQLDKPYDEQLSIEEKSQIKESIINNINNQLFSENKPKKGKIIPIYVWRVAASLLIVVGLGLACYFYFQTNQVSTSIAYTEYYAPKGSITSVTLPDGSKVTLNADSKLKIVKGFEGTERIAYLEGEAFFEVTKNKNKPFVVHTGQLETKVLGTSFDINAYPENPEIEVSVLEGKVSVSDTLKHQVFLLPHQKSVFQKQNLTITNFKNSIDAIGWKERKLIFHNESWKSIAHKLERYYNVDIALSDSTNQTCRLNSTFDHEQLDNVLKILADYTGSSFKKKGNKIFIKNKDC